MCTEATAGQLLENILVDGSFEDNNVGGEWTSINHSLFGPDLICGDSCFGTPFAAGPDGSLVSGNYVLAAGGSFAANSTGNVTHDTVAIPADATTLEFQWAMLASGPSGDPCAGANDGMSLEIAGTQVWSNLDGPVMCTNVNPYQRVVIDLATAAGGPYQATNVGFEFLADATGIPPNIDLTNVMLDDVSINRPLVPPIPPVPSVCTEDAVPDTPESLVGRAKRLHVNLRWSGSDTAISFHVFRRLDSEIDFSEVGEVANRVFVDDLPLGTSSAEYFVVAENAFGQSGDSTIITVVPSSR